MAEHPSLVYGLHAVRAVLERSPERVLELWLAPERNDAPLARIRGLAAAAGIRVQTSRADSLSRMTADGVHQGAVAAVRPPAPWGEADLLDALSQMDGAPLLLVLDGITDPHNLGACLRTAEAAGAHAVVLPRDRSASVDAVARKVAAGAAEFLPVATVTNLARTLDQLKERGIWVVGTDEAAPQTLYESDLDRPLALVLGAEGTGMRRLTRERCDFMVSIPMAGQVESLNVSVAAGVTLYEARRQRLKGGVGAKAAGTRGADPRAAHARAAGSPPADPPPARAPAMRTPAVGAGKAAGKGRP